MHILLTRSGGFATVPALSGDVTIDTDALDPPVREELERLVGAVDLAAVPDRSPTAGAADHRSYELTVRTGGSEVSATFHSPVSDPDVARLVSRLEQLARTGPSG